MARRLTRQFFQLTALSLAISVASQAWAQGEAPEVLATELKDSTVIYEADYFKEYSPVSVNDMISRIPGVGLALNRRGGNRRGLGSGSNEILINGQRITGKENAGSDQLSRISASQVDYIEIIRGTSDEIAIRGGGQVVNVVLLDAQSRSSIAAEVNMDRLQDGTLDPGAKLSYSGQNGKLNYLFHIEAEPRYENRQSFETSQDPDGTLLETREEERWRDQTEYETSFNLGYQFDNSQLQFNGLYGQSLSESETERYIIDIEDGEQIPSLETEDNIGDRDNWEIGGNYEYSFSSGSKFRILGIMNDRLGEYTRDRFEVIDDEEEKNLFLFSSGRDRERIVRSSYTFNFAGNQGFELGVEAAQTIRDNGLRMGLPGEGESDPDYGDLIPQEIDNAFSTVEEIRYENFAVHNWQINDQMALESTLIYELSTIEQTGDVTNKRDFDFIRPKVDFRYDLTSMMQFRATIEKTVSQLSFSDFSSSTDGSDEDEDIQAGNPDIAQEQSWNYDLNLEYRLPNDVGVVNTKVFYRDITDHIDKVDVSPTPDDLQSARGNIGDGYRYGLNLDVSSRLGLIGLPGALLTLGLGTQDSNVRDPFLDIDRRMRHNSRWFARANYRHDITDWNMSYGFSYFNSAQDGSGRTTIDIRDVEREIGTYGLNLFVEKQAFGGVTFRFDANNANNGERCRERYRFEGATADGVLEEVENYCWNTGVKYSLKIRSTF